MSDIDSIMQVFNGLGGCEIMLKKDIFERVLALIPRKKLDMLVEEIELMPPQVGNQEFVTWVKKCRKILKLTQEDLEKGTGIRQEEFSRFERNRINFGPRRRDEIYQFLIGKINDRYDRAA